MQETRVQLLGGEDPLDKERATHSSILAWEIPETEEPGRLQFMERKKLEHPKLTPFSPLCPRPSTVRVLSTLAESRTITSPRAPGAALASACCPSRLISFHSHSGPRLDDM